MMLNGLYKSSMLEMSTLTFSGDTRFLAAADIIYFLSTLLPVVVMGLSFLVSEKGLEPLKSMFMSISLAILKAFARSTVFFLDLVALAYLL